MCDVNDACVISPPQLFPIVDLHDLSYLSIYNLIQQVIIQGSNQFLSTIVYFLY